MYSCTNPTTLSTKAILSEYADSMTALTAAIKRRSLTGSKASEELEPPLNRAAKAVIQLVRPLGIHLTPEAAADFCAITAALYDASPERFPTDSATAQRWLRAVGIEASAQALSDYVRLTHVIAERLVEGARSKPRRQVKFRAPGFLVTRMDTVQPVIEMPTFDALRSEDQICLIFTCPRCGKRNSHGAVGPEFGQGNGHRVSHCPCWRRGYFLREVAAEEQRASDAR